MTEYWSIWERETLAEQHGDFEALLHHLALRQQPVEADHPDSDPPGEAGITTGHSGTSHPPARRPKLRIV